MRKIAILILISALFPFTARAYDDLTDTFSSRQSSDAYPLRDFRDESPNFGRGIVEKSINPDGNRADPYAPDTSAPYGADIRDYNPYRNRDGSLKLPD